MAESERRAGSSEEVATSLQQNFMIPKKEINMVSDMAKWKRSQAYADYMGFILTLNEGVRGKKLTCEYKVSEEARWFAFGTGGRLRVKGMQNQHNEKTKKRGGKPPLL